MWASSDKQLLYAEKEEGYRIIVEECEDDAMLATLKRFYSGSKNSPSGIEQLGGSGVERRERASLTS